MSWLYWLMLLLLNHKKLSSSFSGSSICSNFWKYFVLFFSEKSMTIGNSAVDLSTCIYHSTHISTCVYACVCTCIHTYTSVCVYLHVYICRGFDCHAVKAHQGWFAKTTPAGTAAMMLPSQCVCSLDALLTFHYTLLSFDLQKRRCCD